MTPMQRGLIVIGALLLVLGAISWYWFQYISPYRHLARATPAKQNGFRLTKIDFVKGSMVLLHHMEVFIQLSPELADLGYRSYWRDTNFKVEVRDSAGNVHPTTQMGGFFMGKVGYEFVNKETLVVRLPLNNPPSIRYFDLHVKMGDSSARWRILLPRPTQAIKKSDVGDEWVRLAEIEVQPGVDCHQRQTSPPTMEFIIGLRGATVRTQKPISWLFAIVDAVPEWVSVTSKTGISPKDPLKEGYSCGLYINHTYGSGYVGGLAYFIPWRYRYFRVIGFLQKFATHNEEIDLTGASIRLERVPLNRYGTSVPAGTKGQYGYLAVPVKRVYKTPSGAEVAFLSQIDEGFLSSQDKSTACLAFLITIPDEAKRASPLYRQYGREPEVSFTPPPNASLMSPPTTSSAADSQAKQSMVVMRIKPIQRGKQWVLPEMRLTFPHHLALSERIPVDKVVSVQERRQDTTPR
jgi:hypothetical protein